jgi:hypothetical protein
MEDVIPPVIAWNGEARDGGSSGVKLRQTRSLRGRVWSNHGHCFGGLVLQASGGGGDGTSGSGGPVPRMLETCCFAPCCSRTAPLLQ